MFRSAIVPGDFHRTRRMDESIVCGSIDQRMQRGVYPMRGTPDVQDLSDSKFSCHGLPTTSKRAAVHPFYHAS